MEKTTQCSPFYMKGEMYMIERIVRLIVALILIFILCLILLHYKQDILNVITDMKSFIVSIFDGIFGRGQ